MYAFPVFHFNFVSDTILDGDRAKTSSFRYEESYKVEVSVSIIFAGDGRDSCSDLYEGATNS